MNVLEQRQAEAVVSIAKTLRTPDWEQRRYEIAISALQGQLSNQYGDTIVGRCEFQHAAETSVKFADALIAELQKGGEK